MLMKSRDSQVTNSEMLTPFVTRLWNDRRLWINSRSLRCARSERDVRFIRLWFTDVLGTLKSVAIAPAELEAAFEEGLGFDGSAIEGMTRVSEDDMIVQPGSSTFQILPWRGGPQGTARMFCDILTPDGEPSLGDPRHVLKRTLAKAKDKGFTFYVHPEIEFTCSKARTTGPRPRPRSTRAATSTTCRAQAWTSAVPP